MAGISAGMLADDIGRVTGIRTEARTVSSHKDIPEGTAVIAGTLGHSGLADWIVRKNRINTDGIEGKVTMVDGLGYSDGVIEIRTLPTLHVYEGRDARYAVQTGDTGQVELSVDKDIIQNLDKVLRLIPLDLFRLEESRKSLPVHAVKSRNALLGCRNLL